MIVRFWSAEMEESKEREYLETVRRLVLPELSVLPGYRGSQFLRRLSDRSVEYRVLTFWESMDAVQGMAGKDPKQAFVPDEIARILSRFDTTAEHFESVFQDPPGA